MESRDDRQMNSICQVHRFEVDAVFLTAYTDPKAENGSADAEQRISDLEPDWGTSSSVAGTEADLFLGYCRVAASQWWQDWSHDPEKGNILTVAISVLETKYLNDGNY